MFQQTVHYIYVDLARVEIPHCRSGKSQHFDHIILSVWNVCQA